MRVWGRTLKEVFRNCLRGMAELIQPSVRAAATHAKKEKIRISVESLDVNTLLIEFLSRVVAESDNHNMVFTEGTFTKFGDNFLESELTGVNIDAFDKEIKAVSYQDVDIKRNPATRLYEAMLVFDI